MRKSYLLFTILFSVQIQAQWYQPDGPYGGAVNCIAATDSGFFVGTQKGGLYKSYDVGGNWNSSSPKEIIWVDDIATKDSLLFITTSISENALYKSNNWGETWDPTGIYGGSVSKIYTNDSLILTNGSEAYVSYDNGNNWLETEGLPSFYYSNFDANDSCYFIAIRDGVFFSYDGMTWMQKESDLPNDQYVLSFLINGSDFYAGFSGLGIYHSSDGGYHWENKNTGLQNLHIYCIKKNDTALFVGTGADLFYSVNQGESWTNLCDSISLYNIYDLQFTPNGIFVCCDGGLFKYNSEAGNWENNSHGIKHTTIKSFYKYQDTLIACSYGMYYSSDNGETWHHSFLGLDITNLRLATSLNNNLLVSGYRLGHSKLYLTNCLNNSWEPYSEGIDSAYINYLTNRDNSFIAVSKNEFYVRKITDSSWSHYCYPPYPITNIASTNEDFFINTENGLYRTFGNCPGWGPCNKGLEGREIRIMASDGEYVYSGGDGFLCRYDEEQHEWIRLDTTIDWRIYSITADGNQIAVESTFSIYYSYDFGETFSRVNDSLYFGFYDPLLISNNNLYAGKTGHSVFKKPDLITGSDVSQNLKKKPLLLYPNSAGDFLHLSLRGLGKNHVNVEIIDASGRPACVFKIKPDEHIEINTSNLENGYYVVRVSNLEEIREGGFIKQ